jgi:hypothetical protein
MPEITGTIGQARFERLLPKNTAPSSPLKNAFLAFFNLAKREAKLPAARKITTYVVILSSHPCDVTAC